MTLAKRIIPTILVRGRQMVKGIAFDAWRTVGLAAQAVRIHQMRGVDELVLLDIAATREGRGPDLALVRELTDACFMPLAIGGGIRRAKDVVPLMLAGADKVVLGTIALEQPGVVMECARRFGSQAIVVALDVDRTGRAVIRSGTVATDVWADEFAEGCEFLGVGELLLTAIANEGKMQGYDLELIGRVSGKTGIPVIAAGGCGTYKHMFEAIQAGADAVAAGAMFQFSDQTPRGAAEYLTGKGVEVRL